MVNCIIKNSANSNIIVPDVVAIYFELLELFFTINIFGKNDQLIIAVSLRLFRLYLGEIIFSPYSPSSDLEKISFLKFEIYENIVI